MPQIETQAGHKRQGRRHRMGIAPSLMCADLLHLADEVRLLEEGGADCLHVDVMDGRYVPNLAFGPDLCRALRSITELPLDIHLMVEQPENILPAFAGVQNAVVSIHPETTRHPIRVLRSIRAQGCRSGVAVAPAVPLSLIEDLLPECDRVCLLMVDPGFAGQPLLPRSLQKLQALDRLLQSTGCAAEIEVDGNVSWENIPGMKAAGAEIFVAGTSSLFSPAGNRLANLRRLRDLLGANS